MKAIKRIAYHHCPSRVIGLIGLEYVDAAAPAAPVLPAELTTYPARHLLERTGFVRDQAAVNAVTGQSARQADAQIVRKAEATRPLYPVPTFVAQPPSIPNRLPKSREAQQAHAPAEPAQRALQPHEAAWVVWASARPDAARQHAKCQLQQRLSPVSCHRGQGLVGVDPDIITRGCFAPRPFLKT